MPALSLTIFKAASLQTTHHRLQKQAASAWSASGSSFELACIRTQLERHSALKSVSCDGSMHSDGRSRAGNYTCRPN